MKQSEKGEKRVSLLTLVGLVWGILLLGISNVGAISFEDTPFGNVTIGGYLKNTSVVRIHSPNDLMKMENMLKLEIEGIINDTFSYHIEGRYFYDAVFDIEDGKGIVEVPGARRHLTTTSDLEYFDYVREAYVNFSKKNWFVRLGKQQVVWGKSDGFRLLDIVNPMDYRDWTIAEWEDTRIPLWMLRAEYSFPQVMGNLQFLWIFNNQHSTLPPPFTPWSYKAVDDNQRTADLLGFEFYPNIFDKRAGASGDHLAMDRSQWGVRWNQQIGQLGYTLNWMRKWTDAVYAFPEYAPVFRYVMRPKRVTVLGASFDYNWDNLWGLKNLVARGECAYYIKDRTYGNMRPDWSVVHTYDHFDYVLGLDKNFFVDWWVSAQFFQVIIPNYDRTRDGLTMIANSKRDHYENAWTLFILKDFNVIEGSAEVLLYYSDEGEWWIRPRVKYELINNKVWTSLAFNIFSGKKDDLVGEFRDRDMVRFEIKYMF